MANYTQATTHVQTAHFHSTHSLKPDRMFSPQNGDTPTGGKIVNQTEIVINNVTYEVCRVFDGRKTAKDLLKCQILASAAAALTSQKKEVYNKVTGSAEEVL